MKFFKIQYPPAPPLPHPHFPPSFFHPSFHSKAACPVTIPVHEDLVGESEDPLAISGNPFSFASSATSQLVLERIMSQSVSNLFSIKLTNFPIHLFTFFFLLNFLGSECNYIGEVVAQQWATERRRQAELWWVSNRRNRQPIQLKKCPAKIMLNGRCCERRPLVYFNSRRSQRRPLNLVKTVVHNDGHCQLIPKRTSFDIILKLGLYFGFFFSKCTISVQNS